uniref:Transmembrane protein n=1 Tax=Haptolina ericina TaxID=156174 RepID=A0A7S3B977_9EUKA
MQEPPPPPDMMQDLPPPPPNMLAAIEEEPLEGEATLVPTEIVDPEEQMQLRRTSADTSLELRRPLDGSALLTDSQRRRLAPINSLKRKRRSRKVRVADGGAAEKFVPLVKGARSSVDEAILASFSGDTLSQRQESGEDFWVDPTLYKAEVDRTRQAESRRKQWKRKQDAFGEARLRDEIAAPYKNNIIGYVVVGIGLVAVVFSLFPQLLDNDVSVGGSTFPATL